MDSDFSSVLNLTTSHLPDGGQLGQTPLFLAGITAVAPFLTALLASALAVDPYSSHTAASVTLTYKVRLGPSSAQTCPHLPRVKVGIVTTADRCLRDLVPPSPAPYQTSALLHSTPAPWTSSPVLQHSTYPLGSEFLHLPFPAPGMPSPQMFMQFAPSNFCSNVTLLVGPSLATLFKTTPLLPPLLRSSLPSLHYNGSSMRTGTFVCFTAMSPVPRILSVPNKLLSKLNVKSSFYR